ncbi:hypothetical protein L208DRAFT_1152803, partial [Tricholoma matsutake]
KLQDGTITVKGDSIPAFLYPHDGYNPDDLNFGLLCSPLLLCFFKHIFTSPLSATHNEPGGVKTKGSQAKINSMEEVMPASIAYAAMQVRWCLCSQDDWCLEDGVFNCVKFYWTIIGLFDND